MRIKNKTNNATKSIRLISFILVTFFAIKGNGQDVYKTPSGKKYHLSTCKMVENVSAKLVGEVEVNKYHLAPCKICKPPFIHSLQTNISTTDKSVGQSKSVQCKGKTKKGLRCKHKTKIANGYCFQHTK